MILGISAACSSVRAVARLVSLARAAPMLASPQSGVHLSVSLPTSPSLFTCSSRGQRRFSTARSKKTMTMSELRRQGASTTSSTSPEQAKKKEKEKKVYSAVDLPHTSFSLLEDLEGADLAAPKRQTSFNPDRAASIRASDMNAFDDTSFILSAHTAGQLLPVRAYLDDAEVAFAGRSNVGKSSLLNALIGKKLAHTSKTPGRTQSINFFDLPVQCSPADLAAAAKQCELQQRQRQQQRGSGSSDSSSSSSSAEEWSRAVREEEINSGNNSYDDGDMSSNSSSSSSSSSEYLRGAELGNNSITAFTSAMSPKQIAMVRGYLRAHEHRRAVRVVDMPGYGYAYANVKVVHEWNALLGHYVRSRAPPSSPPASSPSSPSPSPSSSSSSSSSSVPALWSAGALKRLFLLVDARHGLLPHDKDFVDFLHDFAVPFQICLTKCDRVSVNHLREELVALQQHLCESHSHSRKNNNETSDAGSNGRANSSSSNNNDSSSSGGGGSGSNSASAVIGAAAAGTAATATASASVMTTTTRTMRVSSCLPWVLCVSAHRGKGLQALKRAILASVALAPPAPHTRARE